MVFHQRCTGYSGTDGRGVSSSYVKLARVASARGTTNVGDGLDLTWIFFSMFVPGQWAMKTATPLVQY